MGYANSDARRLIIEQNREILAGSGEPARSLQGGFLRWKIPVEFLPEEKIIIRVRSRDSERGLHADVRPALGSVIHLDGQEWVVVCVTEIRDHGYGISATGCGAYPQAAPPGLSPPGFLRAVHPSFELAQVAFLGQGGSGMAFPAPAVAGIAVGVILHGAQAAGTARDIVSGRHALSDSKMFSAIINS